MIKLYVASTPNGKKATIALEEMGIPYELVPISLSKKEQKTESFLKLNLNGRIPVIVDTDEDDFAVMESGAILLYLAEMSGKFLPKGKKERSLVVQWLMFQMGGIGPMLGQANIFHRVAKEKIPFAINRYKTESERLLAVLNTQLEGQDYLAGECSIADFATWPWVDMYAKFGLEIDGLDNLKAWMKRMSEREGVRRGLLALEGL